MFWVWVLELIQRTNCNPFNAVAAEDFMQADDHSRKGISGFLLLCGAAGLAGAANGAAAEQGISKALVSGKYSPIKSIAVAISPHTSKAIIVALGSFSFSQLRRYAIARFAKRFVFMVSQSASRMIAPVLFSKSNEILPHSPSQSAWYS